LENLRRMRAQAQLTALTAPIGVKKADAGRQQAAFDSGSGSNGQSSFALPQAPQDGDYNPAADRDKEQFFARASKDSSWILPNGRTPGQPLELKTGSVIPAAMITGINSELPGQISAQVTQNVFETAWGRHLLIPQGSKLFGIYDSRVVYGQERVLIAWNRLMLPDGSAITLGAMPGADMAGYAGFTDEVNNHYLKIFGSAVLMSLVSGSMAYTMDSLDASGNSGTDNTPTMQQEMSSALAAQLGQASLQILQKNMNIAPTLEIRPGYQFNIVVTKDVVFERPYAAWR
jgi:type IV secretion system protein VirB10